MKEIYNVITLSNRELLGTQFKRKPEDEELVKSVRPLVGPFAEVFDETRSYQFVHNMKCNELMFKDIEVKANMKLERDGYIFVNDILEMLELPKTKAGQIYGCTGGRITIEVYVVKNDPTNPVYVLNFIMGNGGLIF